MERPQNGCRRRGRHNCVGSYGVHCTGGRAREHAFYYLISKNQLSLSLSLSNACFGRRLGFQYTHTHISQLSSPSDQILWKGTTLSYPIVHFSFFSKETPRCPSLLIKNIVLQSVFILTCLVHSLLGNYPLHVNAWKKSHGPPAPTRFPDKDFCACQRIPPCRAHSTSITDFGAVGDGKTLNTHAFQNAVLYLRSFADKGGGQLYVPAGKWLTGSFNLTSHFTLFLDKDAVILGSQDPKEWPIVDPLPSYGRGRGLPGGRHISLIHGKNLTDVVITGDNGTVDGQGAVWWKLHGNGSLDYTPGYMVELMYSQDIIISNLTFKNSPSWNIHPVYCRNVLIQYLTILAPIESPNTDGIDPDSSTYVCIEDCYIDNGDDLISVKSGWDEYGIAYGRPSSNIIIRRIVGGTRSSAGIAMGSEMSGGISNVYVDDVVVHHGSTGIRVKSARGRGGYVRDVYVSNVVLRNVRTGIGFTGLYGDHPDDKYNPDAIPHVERIFIENVVGDNITSAGNFQGLAEYPYKDIFLRNITLNVTSLHHVWNCSYVKGYSDLVYPKPCPEFLRHQSKGKLWPACSLGTDNECKDM